MNITHVKKRLLQMAEECGSQQILAKRLGVSAGYISDILHDWREPGEKILAAMGLEKVVTYRKIAEKVEASAA